MDPRTLCYVELYKNGNNPVSLFVRDEDGESFSIVGPAHILTLRDEDLKLDEKTGKVIISLAPLMEDMKNICGNIKPPEFFDFPLNILQEREYKRNENAIRKDAIFEQDYKNKRLFFYIQNEKLIIKLFSFDDAGKMITEPERETTADKIEIIHNRKAVNVKKLKIGHPYLELPGEVVQAFEKVLKAAELRKLALVPAGISMLNGLPYYKLNIDIPAGMWNQVKSYFEDFGNEGTMTGFLTCNPDRVAELLQIQIEGRV